jgi:hypothetical protein
MVNWVRPPRQFKQDVRLCQKRYGLKVHTTLPQQLFFQVIACPQKVHSKPISALILSIISCKNNKLPGSDPLYQLTTYDNL